MNNNHTAMKTIDNGEFYETLANSVMTKKELAKAYSEANLQIDHLENKNAKLLEALEGISKISFTSTPDVNIDQLITIHNTAEQAIKENE